MANYPKATAIPGIQEFLLSAGLPEEELLFVCLRDRDDEKDVYLLHYNDDMITATSSSVLRKIRGWVVGRVNGTIQLLVDSFGYTPNVYMKESRLSPGEDGLVQVTDTLGVTHTIDTKVPRFTYRGEGAIIRVWRHQEVTYFSSHSKLQVHRSKFAGSPVFKDLYDMMGGPLGDQVSTDPVDSPYCLRFILAYEDLQNITQEVMPADHRGYLKLLGYTLRPGMSSDTEVAKADAAMYETMTLRRVEMVDLAAANTLLEKGLYPEEPKPNNPCLTGGEVVIAQTVDGNAVHLFSPAAAWRERLGDHDGSRHHRAFTLYDWAQVAHSKSYAEMFPIEYTRIHRETLEELDTVLPYPDRLKAFLDKLPRNTGDNRIRVMKNNKVNVTTLKVERVRYSNIFLHYILSLPPALRYGSCKLFDKVSERVDMVVKFLKELPDSWKTSSTKEATHARKILARASKNTGDRAIDMAVAREPNQTLYTLSKKIEAYTEGKKPRSCGSSSPTEASPSPSPVPIE